MISMSAQTTPHAAQTIHAAHAAPKARRITITIAEHTYESLLERSRSERRSISNLAAHLLAEALLNAPSRDS